MAFHCPDLNHVDRMITLIWGHQWVGDSSIQPVLPATPALVRAAIVFRHSPPRSYPPSADALLAKRLLLLPVGSCSLLVIG